MSSVTSRQSPDDDLDGCPVCGHLFVAEDGRCTNCGEALVEIEPRDDADEEPTKSILNWRFGLGLFLFLTFTMLCISEIVRISELTRRDRTFHQLLTISLGCAAGIGFVLMIQGIIRAVRGRK